MVSLDLYPQGLEELEEGEGEREGGRAPVDKRRGSKRGVNTHTHGMQAHTCTHTQPFLIGCSCNGHSNSERLFQIPEE